MPAEFPPASYQGRQYVDSKGCVFIRAGVDGAVTWVPRMTRSRKQICGARPTLTAAARPAPEKAVRQPATTSPAAKTATAPTVAARPAPAASKPAAAPTKVVRAPASASAPAYRTYRTPPAPLTAPVKPEVPARTAAETTASPAGKRVVQQVCAGLSAQSQQYVDTSTGLRVRCGPQGAPHVTYADAAPASTSATPFAARPGSASLQSLYGSSGAPVAAAQPAPMRARSPGAAAPMRIAPRRVHQNQRASTGNLRVPEGYELVWKDDRLNPYRAHQTLAGKTQAARVWTTTVPRRLIPHTASPARVSTSGPGPATPETSPAAGQPASHRYVFLGAFANPVHARRAAGKLGRAGLPSRLGTTTRDGKTYKAVLAGPFRTEARLMDSLRRVRAMGYDRAVLRR